MGKNKEKFGRNRILQSKRRGFSHAFKNKTNASKDFDFSDGDTNDRVVSE